MAHVVSRELNVRQVLAKVALGEADAGVVYRTDALAARTKVESLAIPKDLSVTAEYPIAVVKRTRERELARAWVSLLMGPEGQQRLRTLGFSPAPALRTSSR
jgi:molybdate transport system substrate-binding protein